MKVTISEDAEMEFPLSEEECMDHEAGTLFRCRSGEFFMTTRRYDKVDREMHSLIMFSGEGPNFSGKSWHSQGYRRFKLIGKVNIEFTKQVGSVST